MRGVFDDGSSTITLGSDCYLVPSSMSERVRHAPLNRTQEFIFDVGGGYYNLVVAGEIERHNQGDAEWWLYQKLLALGASGLGDLSVNGHKFPNAMFTSGRGYVNAFKAVTYWYQFACSLPERSASLAAGDSAGADEAEYAGRGSWDIYHLAGEQLGTMGALEIAVSRPVEIKRLTRCYGVRIEDLSRGRQVSLTYSGDHHHDTYADLCEWCWQFQARIGYQEATLTGCGNTFDNVFLQSITPETDADRRQLRFTAQMIQYAA